jgi:DNA-binding NarL/FixJ family response regulator
LKQLTVLIADDDADFRAGLSELLRRENGLKVIGHAKDGLDAVAKAQRLNPDVVFMDFVMPGLDGIEAAKQIVERRPSTKIVLATIHEKAYRKLTARSKTDFVCFLYKGSIVQDLPKALAKTKSRLSREAKKHP